VQHERAEQIDEVDEGEVRGLDDRQRLGDRPSKRSRRAADGVASSPAEVEREVAGGGRRATGRCGVLLVDDRRRLRDWPLDTRRRHVHRRTRTAQSNLDLVP